MQQASLMRLMPLAFCLTVTVWAHVGPQGSQPVSLPIVPSVLKRGEVIREPCPPGFAPFPKRYMIAWNDTPGTDGDFILVVHPAQLFLRSAHNNPNPNYLYWVERLSASQYAKLVAFLDAYRGRLFRPDTSTWPGYKGYRLANARISPWHPDRNLPAAEESQWEQKSQAAVNHNLRRILLELNRALSSPSTKLREQVSINTYPDIVLIKD